LTMDYLVIDNATYNKLTLQDGWYKMLHLLMVIWDF
jgi:hypothetical protein